MKTHLILDGNFMCWKSFHVFGGLSNRAMGTGVIYGFLKDVAQLQQEQATNSVVFTFDSSKNLKRHEVLPSYKSKRHTKPLTKEQTIALKDMRRQMRELREEILPYLGYRNVFFKSGYEADDIIASVHKGLPYQDEKVIVSADRDLYQLLDKTTFMWNPTLKVMMNCKRFIEKYGATPDIWTSVKAIAGCSSDEVPGIKGVGEKTAIAYLNHELPKTHRYYQVIKNWCESFEYTRNLDLVRLPYTGTPEYTVKDDTVDESKWRKLCKRLGMKSLVDSCPRPTDGFGFKRVSIKRSDDGTEK